jgi:diaminopimelate decarboxylase
MINFTAKLSNDTKELIKNKEVLSNIGNMIGYPFSVIMPNEIKSNIDDFKTVFNNHNMNYKIFFAHKCNQSTAVVKECLFNGINIEVSSENELKHSLQNGYVGKNMLASGPKNKEFIWLAIQHSLTISIDNLNELKIIVELSNRLQK